MNESRDGNFEMMKLFCVLIHNFDINVWSAKLSSEIHMDSLVQGRKDFVIEFTNQLVV